MSENEIKYGAETVDGQIADRKAAEGEPPQADASRPPRDEARPDKPVLMTISPALPSDEPRNLSVLRSKDDDHDNPHRNPMFGLLVKDDRDLSGLLAYALYKLSKREWLTAFTAANHREPSSEEMRAFILGEQTARRVASYRRQAEDALAGRAPDATVAAPHQGQMDRPRMETILQQFARGPNNEALRAPEPAATGTPPQRQPQPNLKTMAGYFLILLVLVLLLALMVNYAKSSFFPQ